MTRLLTPLLVCLAVFSAGCYNTMPPHQAMSTRAILFDIRQHSAAIYNAGTSHPFVVFDNEMRAIRVSSNSDAQVLVTAGPSRFASSKSENNWRKSGHPKILVAAGMIRRGTIEGYSFLPQGSPLSYDSARNLPSSAGKLRQLIEARLAPVAGRPVTAGLMLKAYAYLLATAPLSASARTAAYDNMMSLNQSSCSDNGTRFRRRAGPSVCARGDGRETRVLLSPTTGDVATVEQILTKRSPFFPELSPGTIVESSTFSSD